MKPASDSKNSAIKSPAMRKLAKVRAAKSADAAAAAAAAPSDLGIGATAATAAASSSGGGGGDGVEAGPADSHRQLLFLVVFKENIV